MTSPCMGTVDCKKRRNAHPTRTAPDSGRGWTSRVARTLRWSSVRIWTTRHLLLSLRHQPRARAETFSRSAQRLAGGHVQVVWTNFATRLFAMIRQFLFSAARSRALLSRAIQRAGDCTIRLPTRFSRLVSFANTSADPTAPRAGLSSIFSSTFANGATSGPRPLGVAGVERGENRFVVFERARTLPSDSYRAEIRLNAQPVHTGIRTTPYCP